MCTSMYESFIHFIEIYLNLGRSCKLNLPHQIVFFILELAGINVRQTTSINLSRSAPNDKDCLYLRAPVPHPGQYFYLRSIDFIIAYSKQGMASVAMSDEPEVRHVLFNSHELEEHVCWCDRHAVLRRVNHRAKATTSGRLELLLYYQSMVSSMLQFHGMREATVTLEYAFDGEKFRRAHFKIQAK